MKPIKLDRPIIYFDLETTGTDVAVDRIVSMAYTKITPETLASDSSESSVHRLINPGMAIPPKSTAVHGITDEMVDGAPFFKDLAMDIFRVFGNCDLAGYNIRGFDVPMLWEEFNRAKINWDLKGVRILDAHEIFRRKEQRRLQDALIKYCGKVHDGAHNAQADVRATKDVMEAQLEHYADLGAMSVDDLHSFCNEDEIDGQKMWRVDLAGHIVQGVDGIPRYTARKVKGVAVLDDIGFGQWMLKNSFPENTKSILRQIFNA